MGVVGRLVPQPAGAAAVAALAEVAGGAVGVEGVLADCDRRADVVRVPGAAGWGSGGGSGWGSGWGFRWEAEDRRTADWYPQGVAVAPPALGRPVLCTSWYSTAGAGARVTFVDLSAPAGEARPARPAYRHVLLVEPVLREDGAVDLLPVPVHAGGLAWVGDLLHVAATRRGLLTFRVTDLVRLPGPGRAGCRYVLPLWQRVAAAPGSGMRYSFLSSEAADARWLVTGEYGRGDAPTRLARYALDPSGTLRVNGDGVAAPVEVVDGAEGMQGAAYVDGRWLLATSAGRYGRGSLYVGRSGALRRLARVLPVGVEDLALWRERRELWSLTEYPGRRYVFAMDLGGVLEAAG